MIDLKNNYPTIPLEVDTFKEFLLKDISTFEESLSFSGNFINEKNLEITSKWLNIDGIIRAKQSSIIVCNSGNHSITCILQTLKQSHSSIITAPFTYSAFKTIALHNGFKLVPSEFDDEGLTIKGLENTFQKTKSKLIYLQPTIQNPTNAIMSEERRKGIAKFAKLNDITIIEDDAYRFLHPNPPIRFIDLIPENTFHIFSLSKPFNSFIKIAYVVAPFRYSVALAESVRLNSSGSSVFFSDFAAYMMENFSLDKIIGQKQKTAIQLKEQILPHLTGLSIQTYESSFHLWLKLPDEVTSSSVTRALAKKISSLLSETILMLKIMTKGKNILE